MSAQTHPLPSAAAQPQPSPALFFDTLNGYQRTQALKAAIELDVFTAIGEGAHTAEAVAMRRQTPVRGMRILCDYLTVVGFLAKQNGKYSLTPDTAAFLDRRSPHYMGIAVNFMTSPHIRQGFEDIAACVRKGGSVQPQDTFAPDHPMWAEFARSMAPLMQMPAEAIARVLHADGAPRWRVLDIAAGHGIFGITLARHNRNAEIYAVDWPTVLQVAKENAEKAGVVDNWHAKPGSAFDVDFGTGYDVVLLTNFLHHFDPPTNEKLLRKVKAALAPNGRAVILDFVPNDDRVTPPPAGSFALIMLAGTPQGDTYTYAQFTDMCRNAGFSSCDLVEIPPSFERLVVAR